MATPKLTIGIPAWNGERFIGDAIQSVLDQRFTDLEVIVVDDHSVDSTVEIVRSFADLRIALYENERRLGIPGNWNRVLSLAQGEYVCLFHQDDRMQSDNLARKVHVLDSDPTIGLVHSAIEIVVEPSAPYPPAYWVDNSQEDFIVDGPTYFRRLLLEGDLICAPTVVARRADILKAGAFDPELGFAGDYALWMTLCLDRRIAFLNEALVQYRWHADNETHRYRFAEGVKETRAASLKVLAEYRQRPGREQEADLLRASVDALAKARGWAADLAEAKEWLEGQVRNWQEEAERREKTIAELRAWSAELEAGKAWLEQQARNWEAEAERRGQTIAELLDEVAKLNTGKAWLEGQVRNWQEEAERRGQTIADFEEDRRRLEVALRGIEGEIWTRIGRRLRLITPASPGFPRQSKDVGPKDT